MQPTRRKLEQGVYERISSDGRRLGLEVVYKDANGRTRRRTVKGNLQDARDVLASARMRRVSREREPNNPRITFNDVADQFDAAHVTALRPKSREAYRSALKRLRRHFGDKRITTINKPDVRRFVAVGIEEDLKANTINSHLSALAKLYNFARDDLELPVTMPKLKPSERPRPADDQREHRIVNDDELARVLEAVPERTRLYFRFLAETGCRLSEGLGLTPRRVGTADVTFAEQLSRRRELVPLKTSQSRRTIEITRSLAAELRLAAGERVFEHLTHRKVDKAWAKALEHAQLKDPQPVVHDLRHSHVSGLIADGWDPQEVAARIGDTLLSTLRVYAHEFDSRGAPPLASRLYSGDQWLIGNRGYEESNRVASDKLIDLW